MIVWASRAVAAAGLVLLTSCGSDEPSASAAGQESELNLSPEVNEQLAQLRRLVAPFHDLAAAQAAGWSVPLTPCLENAGVGAMGYHFANEAFIDDQAVLLEPELLVYEPQKNGRRRLVAVEYIIPFTLLPQDADPPTLLGQSFHQNLTAGLWALHVWIGRHNPDGLFADWNPDVSCQHAD